MPVFSGGIVVFLEAPGVIRAFPLYIIASQSLAKSLLGQNSQCECWMYTAWHSTRPMESEVVAQSWQRPCSALVTLHLKKRAHSEHRHLSTVALCVRETIIPMMAHCCCSWLSFHVRRQLGTCQLGAPAGIHEPED